MSARNQRNVFRNFDWLTIGLYGVLVVLGLLNIYSTNYDPEAKTWLSFATDPGRQLIWMGICAVLCVVILNIEGEFFIRFSVITYLSVLLLLVLVLLVGSERNGAKAWFGIGSFGIQPSEFAKTSIALLLAWFLSRPGTKFKSLGTRLGAVAIIALPAALIMLQPDVGTILVFIAFVFALYREGLSGNILIIGFGTVILAIVSILAGAADVNYPWFGEQSGIYVLLLVLFGLGILGMVGVSNFVLPRYRRVNYRTVVLSTLGAILLSLAVKTVVEDVMKGYQRERIYVLFGMDVTNPDADYNIRHAKAAIGSGGLTGKGYLNGPMTRYSFVPEQQTDFIFCTVGEEWGFIGGTLIIALFLTLILRIIALAERQRSQFSRIYGYCVASILFMHVLINVGMVLGVAPVIGIPLPFFSYGGSSLLGFTVLLMIMVRLDAERFSVFR
ncbi:MAG: rod shape-determining protein RodA, partial [Flavobacteriales bacterium]|jgi:rod shape determining protein RodA